ncbi:hypothetical transmembrane protein [Flavobacteria bacterium BBFL7]|nr:hypothetical transmembrane protein [Flavobacteria bacterium BBFL7]
MFEIDIAQFSLLLAAFCIWLLVVINNGFRSLYTLYYFLNLTIFLGPVLYYKIGFIAYYTVVSNDSMSEYMYIGITIAVLNIIFVKTLGKSSASLFSKAIQELGRVFKPNRLINNYFLAVVVVCLAYIVIYFKSLPLYKLVLTGEIGERLDLTGSIPLYITVSSIFMIVVPSAFFYFKETSTNKVVIFLLFVFSLIALTAGGNKGIVSFFILFYLLIYVKKLGVLKPLLGGIAVIFIYAVSKGRTTLDTESINYLIESPFRRLFATQGVGFIGRIKMVTENKFNLQSDYNIKQQLYSEMYNMPLGTGSGPTHFLGDIYVGYGTLMMWLAYVIFLLVLIPLIYSADKFLLRRKHSFILWNIFIFIFLFNMSDISIANMLRSSIIITNLFIVYKLSKVKLN